MSFRIAQESKTPLYRLLGWIGPLTHRQALLYHEWLIDQLNEPSRSDYYLMQLTASVEDTLPRAFNKNFTPTKPESKKLRWERRVEVQLTPEEMKEEAKRKSEMVAAMFGFSPQMVASLKPGESIQMGKGGKVKKLSPNIQPNTNVTSLSKRKQGK